MTTPPNIHVLNNRQAQIAMLREELSMRSDRKILRPHVQDVVDGFDGSLPRSFLKPVLSVALLDGPTHGYELLEYVHHYGLASVDLAGVYRTLRAMDHDRLVASSWEASDVGPPRRVYELTELGLDATEAYLDSLATARRFLDAILLTVPILSSEP